MNKIPDGALLQKSKNNVSYVYFPSYYYDKDAKTHNKEKQKRLYRYLSRYFKKIG